MFKRFKKFRGFHFIPLFMLFLVLCGDLGIRGMTYFFFPRGLYGTYYWNPEWQGEAWKKDVLDPDISHHAEAFQQSVSSAPNQQFSVEWRGYIEIPKTGKPKFFTQSDDGSWLWIDDTLVVDNGGKHGVQEAQGKIYLSKGLHKITIRYVQMGGSAALRVFWEEKNDQRILLTADDLLPPDTNLSYYWLYSARKKILLYLPGLEILLCLWALMAIRKKSFSESRKHSNTDLVIGEKHRFKKIRELYTNTALLVFNTLLLFIIINIVLWGGNKYKERHKKGIEQPCAQ